MTYRNNIERVGKHKYRVRIQRRGRVYKRTLRSRENAEAWLCLLEARLNGLDTNEPAPMISEAADAYQRSLQLHARSPVTVAYYDGKYKALLKVLGDMPLDRIGQQHLDHYIQRRLAAGASPGTVNKEIAALRLLHRESGVSPGWRVRSLSHNPAERAVRSPDEVAMVWLPLSPRARAACGLALLAGMRASEVYRADASWLRRDQREIWLPVRKRSDPMKTALVDSLAELLPDRGPLVTATKSEIDYELQVASKMASISPPYRGPGGLRHHCATWGVEYSDGRFTVADARLVLGHHSRGSTARYVHSQQVDRKRQFLELVEDVFSRALKRVQSGYTNGKRRVQYGYTQDCNPPQSAADREGNADG